jgi:hypothetical protein
LFVKSFRRWNKNHFGDGTSSILQAFFVSDETLRRRISDIPAFDRHLNVIPYDAFLCTIDRSQHGAEGMETHSLDDCAANRNSKVKVNELNCAQVFPSCYSLVILQSRHENSVGIPNVDTTVGSTRSDMTAIAVESDPREVAANFVVVVTERCEDLVGAQVNDFYCVIANAGR